MGGAAARRRGKHARARKFRESASWRTRRHLATRCPALRCRAASYKSELVSTHRRVHIHCGALWARAAHSAAHVKALGALGHTAWLCVAVDDRWVPAATLGDLKRAALRAPAGSLAHGALAGAQALLGLGLLAFQLLLSNTYIAKVSVDDGDVAGRAAVCR